MKKTFLPPVRMLQEAKDRSRGWRLIIEILIFILVFEVTQTAASIPVVFAMIYAIFTSDTFVAFLTEIVRGNVISPGNIEELTNAIMHQIPDWVLLVQLFSTGIATALTLVFCRYIERRPLSSMGLRRKHMFTEYALGAGVGIGLISLCVGICLLTGSIRLEAAAFSPVMWILFLLGFVIQGMSEEVLCRGYMMVSVSRRNALWLAVLTNSLIFSLLHLANPGFGLIPLVNIILFGILESVYVLKRGDLWGACAIHSLWNFFQGNVFGISVSGTGVGSSPLVAVMTPGHTLLNGGTFGIEGGLTVTVVIGIAVLVTLFFLPTKKEEIVKAPILETTEA